MRNVVVLKSGCQHVVDRAWLCNSESEAKALVLFLRNNKIQSEQMTIAQHEYLVHEAKTDLTISL